ncbi:MAG: SRPBCC family protein [Mycobacterium sp.]
MKRYVREETVHAPAARVWDVLVDVQGWPAWTESMREIKRLDDGPLAVGSRSRVTQPKGRPMVWTVTELEPLREFAWVAKQPGLSLEAVHRIDDAGDHVATTLEFNVRGPLAFLAAPLAGGRIRSYLAMESEGLKRAAERA